MPLFPDAPIRLRTRGRVREHVLDGMVAFAVNPDGVLLSPLDGALHATTTLRIPFDAIDGVRHEAAGSGTLWLHQRGGVVVVAAGDRRVADLAADILARGRTIPELARAVRALGTSDEGSAQEAFFRPLLQARRNAVAGGIAAIEAFDADRLRREVERTLDALAAEREPERPSARRALEACLYDAAEPLLLALHPLADAAVRARTADSSIALDAWRSWLAAVRHVFERADAAWPEVRVMLATPRGSAPTASPTRLERLLPPWIR